MPNKDTGREVLPHPAAPEAATPCPEQSADYAGLIGKHTKPATDELRGERAHAIAVMDRNRQSFDAYLTEVRRRIEADARWLGGTDYLRAFLREGGFITPGGDTFRVCHGMDAVWLRELCRRHPDIAPHILPTLRPSKFDSLYPDLLAFHTLPTGKEATNAN